jgi:hypothetical protein
MDVYFFYCELKFVHSFIYNNFVVFIVIILSYLYLSDITKPFFYYY